MEGSSSQQQQQEEAGQSRRRIRGDDDGRDFRGGQSHRPDYQHQQRVKNEPLLTMLPSEMLEMVIENLSLTDLQALCRVNQHTKEFTTDFILKRDMCAVKFSYDPQTAMFVHCKRPSEQPPPLSSLTSCMETSSKFPCTNFQFSGGSLSPSGDAAAFFASQNGQVKGLSVWFTRGQNLEKSAALLDTLQGLKNLESLNIGGELTSGNHLASAVLTSPSILFVAAAVAAAGPLKKLKFLTIKSSISINANLAFISALLSSAPNLEGGEIALDPDNIRLVDLFISKNKVHLLNEMTFEPDHEARNLEFYEKFLHAISSIPLHQQRLNKLIIFSNLIHKSDIPAMERAAHILEKILQFSAQSLKTLIFNVPAGFLRLMKNWGSLKNLNFMATYFKQFTHDFEDYLIFPMMEANDLNEIFPALASISLAGVTSFIQEEEPAAAIGGGAVQLVAPLDEICFPLSVGIFSKVQRLHLMLHFPTSWLGIFPRVFPNVVCLLIGGIQNFERMSHVIWNWNFPYLTIMELEILVDDQWYEGNSFPRIDAAFTGLDKDFCVQLRKNHEEKDRGQDAGDLLVVEDVENFRIHSSMLKLNALRDLKISFMDEDDRVKESYNLLNGCITGELALGLMAGLRVSVLVTAKLPENIQRMVTSLQSMGGYSYVGPLRNPLPWDD